MALNKPFCVSLDLAFVAKHLSKKLEHPTVHFKSQRKIRPNGFSGCYGRGSCVGIFSVYLELCSGPLARERAQQPHVASAVQFIPLKSIVSIPSVLHLALNPLSSSGLLLILFLKETFVLLKQVCGSLTRSAASLMIQLTMPASECREMRRRFI